MTTIDELFQVALGHHQAGELGEALRIYLQIVDVNPRHAEANFNLANLYAAQSQPAEAAAAYRRTLACQPGMVAAHHALGMLLQSQGEYAPAIACHRQAISLDPVAVGSIGALAVSLQLAGQLEAAVVEYGRYLEHVPDDVSARFNLATVLHMLRRFREAEAEYDRCAQSPAATADVFVQLGNCVQTQGNLVKAAECFRQATRLDPGRPEPHFRLGAALLAAGNFPAGWDEFEWRLMRVARDFPQPMWDGSPLDGKRIVIYAEWGQGLGDTLQFARYIPLVEQRGGEVVFAVQKTLLPLLLESGFAQAIEVGTSIGPPADSQAPQMSLPRIFDTRLDTIPGGVPYLSARPDLVDAWRERLRPYGRFKIGIHWHGSDIAIGEGRVTPLAAFEALARVSGVTLVSLQKQEGLEQIAAVADRFEVVDFGDQLDREHGALMDSAAIMKNLDLLVTNDTATGHLAGGLAVPVWVALQYSADWRWLANREDSPWYPTMRLFRQAKLDDWSGVFERMAKELAVLVASR